MDKKHYPTAFLVVIAIALYIMYGEQFSLKNIDFKAYHTACYKYKDAKEGDYSDAEIQSIVNKIHYLLPGSVAEIKEPLKKEIKLCAETLAKRVNK